MTARPRILARRRGQGTTEYIVLVGLIAILLVAAVLKFSNQIKITFIGTSGDVDQMTLDGSMGAPTAGAHGTNSGKKFSSVQDPNDTTGTKFIWQEDPGQ